MEDKHGNGKAGILVVDDHPLILAGLSQIINRESDLICCGTAETLACARKAFQTCNPCLVTIDLGMPDGDSVDLIKEFCAARPSVPILVVSQCDESLYAERILKAGARGYVAKERCTEEILIAIRSMLAGEIYVSKKVAALALRQMAGRKSAAGGNGISLLTNRELQVLRLLGAGLGSRVVAAKLNLSVKTIETHRENIKRKLGLPDASALIHYATNCADGKNHLPPSSQ